MADRSSLRYSASGGESLRDIARNLLGDAILWWRIADANALAISADAPLVAGQSLLIPSQALNVNSSETLKPYEPGKATGSLDPKLPVPANKDSFWGQQRRLPKRGAALRTSWLCQGGSCVDNRHRPTVHPPTQAFGGCALPAKRRYTVDAPHRCLLYK